MKCSKVLCVGTYESLQVARSLVLQQHGYQVDIAKSYESAVMMATEQHFDAAVLCDSLGAAESERLAHELRVFSPATRVVVLNRRVNPAAAQADTPEMLIALVRFALADRRASAAPEGG